MADGAGRRGETGHAVSVGTKTSGAGGLERAVGSCCSDATSLFFKFAKSCIFSRWDQQIVAPIPTQISRARPHRLATTARRRLVRFQI